MSEQALKLLDASSLGARAGLGAGEDLDAAASSGAGKDIAAPAKDWWQDLGVSAAATCNISDVEPIWRELERNGIESPGQSFDFTRRWIERFKVPVDKQLFVTGEARGKVVALLPLKRDTRAGADVLTWFSGSHVGCNAPLVDREAFASLSVAERAGVWRRMSRAMTGADLVILHSIPAFEEADFFAGLGDAIEVECLYRSVFDSWEQCRATQHTRSRRKHDRQQGAKLRAMGEVAFVEYGPGDPGADKAIETLFAQKAVRFAQQGIIDPFADPDVREFYREMFHDDNGLAGKLHVLTLDGEIVAVRYNLAHGKFMFALISSRSEREELRPGSPGKQNILHAMESIFRSGYTVCDMGAGYSDEKRHWCNVSVPLRTHYLPLSLRGEMVARLHRFKYRGRKFIKNNSRLFDFFKTARSAARGRRGGRD